MGDVGDRHQDRLDLLVRLFQGFVEFLDPVGDFAHPGDDPGGILFVFLLLADLLGNGVPLAAQPLNLLDDLPPLGIQVDEALQVQRLAALAHLADDEVDVLSEIFDVQHGLWFPSHPREISPITLTP